MDKMLHLLPSLSLHRLSVKVETFLGVTPSPKFNFDHPAFASLTHLDIVNPSEFPNVDWTGLHTLPNLAHLSFGDLYAGWHLKMIPTFRDLLVNCQPLLRLVLISDDLIMVQAIQELMEEDDRVAFLPCFNYPKDLNTFWRDVDRGEADYWDLPYHPYVSEGFRRGFL